MNYLKIVFSVVALSMVYTSSDAQFLKKKKNSIEKTTYKSDDDDDYLNLLNKKPSPKKAEPKTTDKPVQEVKKDEPIIIQKNTVKQAEPKTTDKPVQEAKKDEPSSRFIKKTSANSFIKNDDDDIVLPIKKQAIKQEEPSKVRTFLNAAPPPTNNEKNLSIKERLKKRKEESNQRIDKLIEDKIKEEVSIPDEIETTPTPTPTYTAPEPVYTKPSNLPMTVPTVEIDEDKKLEEVLIAQTLKEANSPAKNINPEVWKLEQCIAYAHAHNLQITESELNTRLANLTLEQTKASRIPTLNLNGQLGKRFGRAIDPFTNTIPVLGQDIDYNNVNANSQVLLFGWFGKKYQQQQNQYDVLAANATYLQTKNDVALNITTGYLRILMAREQLALQENQLKLIQQQLTKTKQLANNTRQTDYTAQVDAQLNADSSRYITSKNDVRMAELQLKALMNFDFEKAFDIVNPNLNAINYLSNYKLTSAEEIYEVALKNQQDIKANQYKLYAAKKAMMMAKTTTLPQITLGVNTGTGYSNTARNIISQTYDGTENLGYVYVGNADYPLSRPKYIYNTQTIGIQEQYKTNIQTTGAVAINMPIFNGRSARTNIERAKIAYVSQKITLDNSSLKLKQDIYQAYSDVKAALQQYNAFNKSKASSVLAVEQISKRFETGTISSYDYTNAINALNKANTSLLAAKYDLLFKLKVIDYYMGNTLKF
jgi:outer membrane protein